LSVVALPYGRSENLAAGEAGLADFFLGHHEGLRTLGKRPDSLIFSAGKLPATGWAERSATGTSDYRELSRA
jgi:hypothetical protein